MTEIDKARAQRDAQRTAAGRRAVGSSAPEHAILRHLGVELYEEHRRTAAAAHEPQAEQSTAPPAAEEEPSVDGTV